MSAECENCGLEVWGPMCPNVPCTDGLGRYWVEQRCPNCEAVFGYIYPAEDGDLADRHKRRAVTVDDPPAVTEMPDHVATAD